MLGWASQLLRAKAQKRTTSPSQPFPAPLLPDLCCCAGRSIRRTTSSPSCSREPLLGGQQNSSAAGAGPLSGAGVRAKLSPAGISSQWGTRGCRVQARALSSREDTARVLWICGFSTSPSPDSQCPSSSSCPRILRGWSPWSSAQSPLLTPELPACCQLRAAPTASHHISPAPAD